MTIHQLSVNYQLAQDRILVQISTHSGEALRLWLTRRLVNNLFPHLNQAATNAEISNSQLAVHDDLAKKMLMEFKKQASIDQGDFKTPFKTDATVFPVGAEPLLVTSINLTPAGNGALRIGFEEKLTETIQPRGFQVIMESSLLHSFMHLLESAIKVSGWGVLQLSGQNTTKEDADEKPRPADPVRYLN